MMWNHSLVWEVAAFGELTERQEVIYITVFPQSLASKLMGTSWVKTGFENPLLFQIKKKCLLTE